MKIRILWMYHDLLDLYGDFGNLLVLSRRLDEMGVDVEVERASLGDSPDFSAYNLVYIGPGKARNLCAASAHLLACKESVLQAVQRGTLFFVTGNARLMLGKSFRDEKSGKEYQGLGLFDYTGVETGDVFISDVICCEYDSTEKAYGFINRTSYIENNRGPYWFETLRGAKDADRPGSTPGAPKPGEGEGNLTENVWSSWLLGPLLVKNPHLCRKMLTRLCPGVPQDFDDALAVEAWRRTLNDFPEGR